MNNNFFDYQVLKKSLYGSYTSEENLFWSKHDLIDYTNHVNIYKVVSSENDPEESSTCKDLKILLLHDTKAPNVESTLRSEFKPSKYGDGGPGIYHTESISLAYNFGKCYAKEHHLVKKLS